MTERKSVLLRLDLAVHDALARWASDELRSTNAEIDVLLRRALADEGRLPGRARPMRPGGWPPTGGRTGTSLPPSGDDQPRRRPGRCGCLRRNCSPPGPACTVGDKQAKAKLCRVESGETAVAFGPSG